MVTPGKPAVSFAAVPGRRRATIDLARRIEQRGFAGLYCPSFGDGLALCEALALATTTIPFGTSIANIYTRHPYDYAQTAAFIHEISGGRFRFGIGVSHAPTNARLGVTTGKPLADMRRFVGDLRTGAARSRRAAADRARHAAPQDGRAGRRASPTARCGPTPRARTCRRRCRRCPGASAQRDDFFVGNMIPTCVCDDRAAGAAVMRRALRGYVQLPNYQHYWIEAGYEDEMHAIQRAIAGGEDQRIRR